MIGEKETFVAYFVLLNSEEKKIKSVNIFFSVIYLILYHAIFVFFAWTYWKSIFTLPQQPNQKVRICVASQT